MKKHMSMFVILVFSVLLGACSLKQDVANLYKQETPLESEISIPESISLNHDETFKVILTQDGKRVEGADYVHVEIWKQDGSVTFDMEQAEEEGNGTYSLRKNFDSEGLYYIKLHASNAGSIIMPQKQFVIGDLSKSELEFLQKGLPKQQESHQGHH